LDKFPSYSSTTIHDQKTHKPPRKRRSTSNAGVSGDSGWQIFCLKSIALANVDGLLDAPPSPHGKNIGAAAAAAPLRFGHPIECFGAAAAVMTVMTKCLEKNSKP